MLATKDVRRKFALFVLDSSNMIECNDAGMPMIGGRKKPRTPQHYSIAFNQLLRKTGNVEAPKKFPIPEIISTTNKEQRNSSEAILQIEESEDTPLENLSFDFASELESNQAGFVDDFSSFEEFETPELNFI